MTIWTKAALVIVLTMIAMGMNAQMRAAQAQSSETNARRSAAFHERETTRMRAHEERPRIGHHDGMNGPSEHGWGGSGRGRYHND
jgi:hypothetical protein